MIDSDNLQRIELYLENQLKGDDLVEFEKLLKNEKELANYIANFHLAVKEIQEYSKEELKGKLKYIHQEFVPDKEKQRKRRALNIRFAAVFLGLIFISGPILYYQHFKRTSNEQLFSEYFAPYANIVSDRGAKINEANLLKESAMYYYDKKEFKKALPNFEELLKKDKSDITVLFYYGITCLGAGEGEKAIEVFSKLSEDKEIPYYEQVNWYLALGYIKLNKKAESNDLLNKIIQNNESFANRSQELLDRLY